MREFDHTATLRTHYLARGVDTYFDLDGIEVYETRIGWVDRAGRMFFKPDAEVAAVSYRVRSEFRSGYGPLRWDSASNSTSRFTELVNIAEVA